MTVKSNNVCICDTAHVGDVACKYVGMKKKNKKYVSTAFEPAAYHIFSSLLLSFLALFDHLT